MSLYVGTLILLLLSLAPFCVAMLLIARQVKLRFSSSVPSASQAILQSCGFRLRSDINRHQFDLSLYLGLICSIGPYIGFLILMQVYLVQRPLIMSDFIGFVLCTGALSGLALFGFTKVLRKLRASQYALECELGIGKELDQLQRQGYHVFHDVPLEEVRDETSGELHIDHVVVGRNGVFIVDVKAPPKPGAVRNTEHEISLERDWINIPGEGVIKRDTQSVIEANRKSHLLGQWLTEIIGEKIAVSPLLIFPRWAVSAVPVSSSHSISVLNESQLRKGITKLKGQRLADANVSKLAKHLDMKVRAINENLVVVADEQPIEAA